MKRLLALAAIAAALAACSSGRDETWIGKNVGVSVDSSAGTKAAADAR